MKKITALFLALVMTLSLCTVTAFADDPTVGYVFNTYGSGFPTSSSTTAPDDAWTNDDGSNKCFVSGEVLYFVDGGGAVTAQVQYTSVVVEVSPGSHYVFEDGTVYHFYINDGELSSIEVTGSATYTPPVTVIDSVTISSIDGVNAGDKVSDVKMHFAEDSFAEIDGSLTVCTGDGKSTLPADTTFVAGEKYVIFTTLKANEGYAFKLEMNEELWEYEAGYTYNAPEGFSFTPRMVGNEYNEETGGIGRNNDDFTPKNAIYAQIRIEFTVTDDGCGLDCETLAKVGMAAVGVVTAVVVTKVVVDKLHAIKAAKIAAAEEAKLVEMPMVAFGDSGEAVTTLQTELNAQGYDCGEVDGIFGQNTLNAVIAFQTAKGLTADGVVGAQTWGALL